MWEWWWSVIPVGQVEKAGSMMLRGERREGKERKEISERGREGDYNKGKRTT